MEDCGREIYLIRKPGRHEKEYEKNIDFGSVRIVFWEIRIEMATDTTKIIQDTRVIQQVVSKFPPQGNQINIIVIGQLNEGKEQIEISGLREAIGEFDLLTLIESLPPPRIQNLMALAIKLAIEKFSTKNEAVKFLGISFGSLYKYQEVDKLLNESDPG